MQRALGLARSARIAVLALFHQEEPQHTDSDPGRPRAGSYWSNVRKGAGSAVQPDDDDNDCFEDPFSLGDTENQSLLEAYGDEEGLDAQWLPTEPEPECRCCCTNLCAQLHWSRIVSAPLADGLCCSRWNPLWWVVMVGASVCVLLGKLVHAPLRQSGPVRPDEEPVERQLRLQHCYVTDSVFAMMALRYSVRLIGSQQNTAQLADAVGLTVALAYVFNNCFLLHALRLRSRVGVRLVVANYVSFTMGLMTLMVCRDWSGVWPLDRALTVVNRLFATLFFGMGAWAVTPLWSSDSYVLPGSWRDATICIIVGIAGISVWMLVIFAASVSSKAVWQVVINGA